MLNGLQKEIGFTNDEIMIIISTSLDHDNFTNLICHSTEFMKWFTINFEGESREELDFLEAKIDIWRATTTLGAEVLDAAQKLPTEGQEIILDEKWWEKLRHQHFGCDMAQKLKDFPELKMELRDLFRSQEDRLSYYDLFQFIDKKLLIKLDNWEEDALEGRLDRLGMAFVEFNEFNEFSMIYDLDWGEALIENDLEEQLDKKINVSYKEYKVTKDDFFQGCCTMLRSEKAALAQARAICAQLGDKKFEDIDFGPKNDNDLQGSALSLYKTGKEPEGGYVSPDKIQWLNAEQICPRDKTP